MLEKKRLLLWFNQGHRVQDNEMLAKASNYEVLPFFILPDNPLQNNKAGVPYIGYFRMQFLLQSLQDLHDSLVALGAGLCVEQGHALNLIPSYAYKYAINEIWTTEPIGYNEKEICQALYTLLQKRNVLLRIFETDGLIENNQLPFAPDELPDVFTQFRKKAEYQCTIRNVVLAPEKLQAIDANYGRIPSLAEMGYHAPAKDKRVLTQFTGGEMAGRLHLKHYFKESTLPHSYKLTRNGMMGMDYSTKLSPWLATGNISPVQVYYEVKSFEAKHGANDSTYWIIFELWWREFFRFTAKKFGKALFLAGGLKGKRRAELANNKYRLKQWMEGNTGNDFVDAHMLELKHSGFMSNRGRQNVASYLVNDLKVDWRLGAWYFESQLIDYDVSSNWGNWCYIAGVGNDPREGRYFNTSKQADQYDPDASFRSHWLKGN